MNEGPHTYIWIETKTVLFHSYFHLGYGKHLKLIIALEVTLETLSFLTGGISSWFSLKML